MSAIILFQIVNGIALVSWAFLILFPRFFLTERLIRSFFVPALLALIYLLIVVLKFGQLDGGFDSLPKVMELFKDRWGVTAGWTHFLIFDLFVGIWIVGDAEKKRISRWLTTPALALTFLLGPVGMLLYLLERIFCSYSVPFNKFLKETFFTFYYRQKVMTLTALLLIVASFVFSFLAYWDPRVLDNTLVWLKPAKVSASLALYFFTLAYILGEMKRHVKSLYINGFVAWSFSMVVAQVSILSYQAMYNQGTTIDLAFFAAMMALMVVNMLVVAHLTWKWLETKDRQPALLWLGVSYGLASFLLGSLLGTYLLTLPSSHVGVYNAATLVPLLGWNQSGGELRIPYFFALHGLQVLTLFGIYAEQNRYEKYLVHIFGMTWILSAIGLFILASYGMPLLK